MKRLIKFSVATVAASALFTGTAFAHYCTNASKKDGAGNAGVLFADVSTDNFVVKPSLSTVRLNPQGNITGGFMDVHVDFDNDGVANLVLTDVFAQTGLPPREVGDKGKALLAGGCGRGIDTNVPFFAEYCPPS